MKSYKKPSNPSLVEFPAHKLALMVEVNRSMFPECTMFIDDLKVQLDYKVITDSLCEKFINENLSVSTKVIRRFLENNDAIDIGATKFKALLWYYSRENNIDTGKKKFGRKKLTNTK